MKDVLLVEDNLELAELMKAFLEKEGFSVCHKDNGENAIMFLQEETIKIILLDIMLPGLDGFAVCKAVREKGSVPILILSAKSGKTDKLTGYQLGADDYMEKPVDIEILVAKVNALIDRTYRLQKEQELLVSGGIAIDKQAHKAYMNHEALDLNVKEYELLLLLAENPGKTLSKEYLFNKIWGFDSFSENQTLTVHIKMLRGKIEKNPKVPERIQTVWGVGYRYEEV